MTLDAFRVVLKIRVTMVLFRQPNTHPVSERVDNRAGARLADEIDESTVRHGPAMLNDKQKELVEQIGCPVPWTNICPEEELARLLRYFWFKPVQKHQRDGESRLLSHDDWQPDEFVIEALYGPYEVDSALAFISSWRPVACPEYESNYARFSKLRAAGAQDHKKHYCQPNVTDDEVAELSISRGGSVLYPRTDVAIQTRVSWAALLEVW